MECGMTYFVGGLMTAVGILMMGGMIIFLMHKVRSLACEVKRLESSRTKQPLATQSPDRPPNSANAVGLRGCGEPYARKSDR